MEKTFVIHQNAPLEFQGYLFNRDDQILNQGSEDKTWFYLMEDSRILGRFVLHIHDQKGFSPYRAPFGSFEFQGNIRFDSLDLFIKYIIQFSRERKLDSVDITSYPFCYDKENSSLIATALISNGFFVKTWDLNFHINFSTDFITGLHESERRRLNKSEKEGYHFEILAANLLPEMHRIIASCRQRKGFPLSMGKDEFMKLFSDFPDDYIPFGLKDKGKLIAVSVGVKVNKEILYDFLPADMEEYKSFSPIVLLKKKIFDYCKDKGYKIFDLGIATASGIPNYGLIRFKENLGGIPSLKLSYELTLNK